MLFRHATNTMGTRFEFVLAGDDEGALRSAADMAIEEIEVLNDRLSLFRSDSLVSYINRTAHERPARLDRPTFDLLWLAREVWTASGGAFDVTMGAVMRQLGLHDGGASSTPAVWGMDAVELDPGLLTVTFTRPGIELDLGGLAKGHALDVAASILRDAGVRRAILHAGTSSVVAIGTPEDQPDGFRIALGLEGAPDAASDSGVVALRDAALSVSAPRGRSVEREGQVFTHILDPRTGSPSPTPVRLAAVVGPSGAVTEAWSTALVVLGSRPAGMPPDLVSVVYPHPR